VAQHGGVCHIITELNQGTTIELYLPCVAEDCAPGAKEPSESGGGNETILFVEDNEMVRDLTCKVLSSAGYTVIVAGDGVEALDLLPKHLHRIDLALLDIVMPRLGGEAVYRALRSQRPEVPVLFASGQGADRVTDMAVADAVEILQKPFRRAELLGSIRRALDGRVPSQGDKPS
jgi:two-component system cell cycle sensor histidine kinase/response regulator CckA